MKRILAIGVILLFIGMSISSSTGFNVDKVSTTSFDGKTLYVGGSGPNNYTKIQDAINDSENGDTVFVYDDSSPYEENVMVNKSINLIGEDRNKTVIKFNNKYRTVIEINTDRVNISDFTIESYYRAGIFLNSSKNTIITDNIFINRFGDFISDLYLQNSSNNIITGNIINNIGGYELSGIELLHSSDNIITGNTINHNEGDESSCIYLQYSSNNIITGNIINKIDGYLVSGIELLHSSDNIITENFIYGFDSTWRWGWGIYLEYDCYNNSIIGNKILDNGHGIYLYFSGYCTIKDNYLKGSYESERYGIGLIYYDNNTVIGNTITNYSIGIRVFCSDNNTINDNNISLSAGAGMVLTSRFTIISNNTISSSSDYGIVFTKYDYNNIIYHNIFINNTQNANDRGNNTWDNGYPSGGNYWDDYTGNDSDGDGIGDIPYNISDGDNQDRYPLGYFDTVPPQVDIFSPKQDFLYIMNYPLFNFFTTVIIGNLEIIVNATDNKDESIKVEFYIDDELKTTFTNGPYNWTWDDRVFFRHKIKVIAYDNAGNKATKEMKVWKFL